MSEIAANSDRVSGSPARLWYVVACLARLMQGLSLGVVLFTRYSLSGSDMSWVLLRTAILLCGIGCGLFLDRRLHLAYSRSATLFVSGLALLLGLGVFLWSAFSVLILSGAFVVGLGVSADWGTASWLARNSLSGRSRWAGLRFWNITLLLGVIAGFSSDFWPLPFLLFALVASLICWTMLLTLPKLKTSSDSDPAAVDAKVPAAAASETAMPAGVETNQAAPDEDTEECDADECCGGVAREFEPTSFGRGVLVSLSGRLAVFGQLVMIALHLVEVDRAGAVYWSLAAAVAGNWLLFSAAPLAGYTVTLLPFLVLGAPAVIACSVLPVDSAWLPVALLLTGFCCGAVTQGHSSITGELFADCPTDGARTRVLAVASFAAGLFVLVNHTLLLLCDSVRVVVGLNAFLFPVGILILRAIQTPIMASPGQEDSSPETSFERDDVVAALRQQ